MTTSNFSNSTEAAKSGLNLTLDPVEKFIFAGLQKQMLKVFEAKSAWVTSTDKTKTLQQLFGSPSQEASELNVTYPYIFMYCGTLAESPDRANLKATAVRGIANVVPSSDNRRSFRVEYIPVDFTVTVEYVTNDYKEVLKFARLWLFSRHKGFLNFDVVYGRATFAISCRPDAQIQIPLREAELEGPSEYTLSQTLVIQGYISSSTLIEQQVTTSIEANFTLPDGSVFWSLSSPETDVTPPDPTASVSNSTN